MKSAQSGASGEKSWKAVQVGSQLFINRHDTPERVAEMVGKMAAAKLSLIRIFLVWDHLEPREGVWRWEVYDRLFAEAERHGLRVIATLMAVSPPGWMRITGGLQDVCNLDDPAVWARCLQYLDRVVSHWKDAPALHSWILWNEPCRVLSQTSHTVAQFQKFLQAKYGEIGALNRHYFRQYAGFAEIGHDAGSDCYQLGFGSRIEQIDWLAFTVENLMEKLGLLAAAVRERDPVHPLHVNPHRVSQCLFDSGQSLWREAEIVDFMGFSAHPAWHSLRFPEDRVQQSVAMFADLTRGATLHPEGKFWCTEMQAGPTLVTAFRPSSPTPGELRRWMWESAASGAEAILFWCFNTREDGYEAGEWSLLQADFSPSPRLQEVTRVTEDFAAHAEWFASARPAPEVAILCSEASHLLGLIEGEGETVENPRNRQMASDAVCGAYLLASDLGYEVTFLDEKRLCAGKIPASVRVLILPGCVVLGRESVSALDRWTESGGVVIADSFLGWKNEFAGLERETTRDLAEIFGAEALDFSTLRNLSFADDANGRAPGWFFRVAFGVRDSVQILARWPDQSPAVVAQDRGTGRAIRLGTVFFQRYLPFPEEEHRRFLQRLMGEILPATPRLDNPSAQLRLRRLATDDGVLGVLINGGNSTCAEIFFSDEGYFKIQGHPDERVTAGATRVLPVAADGVVCFRFQTAV